MSRPLDPRDGPTDPDDIAAAQAQLAAQLANIPKGEPPVPPRPDPDANVTESQGEEHAHVPTDVDEREHDEPGSVEGGPGQDVERQEDEPE